MIMKKAIKLNDEVEVVEAEVVAGTEVATNQELAILINESGLDETKANMMSEQFQGFFKQASEWEDKIKMCVVNDRTQVAEMKLAREVRLSLRRIRIDVEATRKKLKEQSLREGKAIDGVANILKALIEPMEETLTGYEKFAEIEDKRIAEELLEKRTEELAPYGIDTSFYRLGEMDEESYSQLLDITKKTHEEKERLAEQAEKDRIAKEKADLEAREAQRKENERLKKEAVVREAQIAKERKEAEEKEAKIRAEAEAERKKLAEETRKQKEIQDAQLRKEQEERAKAEAELKAVADAERKKQEAVLQKERKEREKLQAEIKAKEDAEKKEQERIEAEQKAKEQAERDAKLAPDKDKLLALAKSIKNVPLPELSDVDAKSILANVSTLLGKIDTYINDKVKELK